MKHKVFTLFILTIILLSCNRTQKQVETVNDTIAQNVDTTKLFSIDEAFNHLSIADKYEELKKTFIIQEYTGMINSVVKFGDSESYASDESFVVTNKAEYESFTNRIYPYVISKTEPQQENDDVLRKKPEIDFNKYDLIVLVRNDNPFAELRISDVNTEVNPALVVVDKRPLSDNAKFSSYPLYIGSYSAYLVNKINKKVQFIVKM